MVKIGGEYVNRPEPGDPLVAARAVNLLVDVYKEKRLQLFSDPQSPVSGTQLAEYEANLKESEGRMEAFKLDRIGVLFGFIEAAAGVLFTILVGRALKAEKVR